MSRPYHITSLPAIRLLSSPLRQSMLDWIVSRGPATVAQLAVWLDRPADRLYYHVRLLERAGLLKQRPGGDRAEAEYDVPGRPMILDYGTDSAARRRAIAGVVNALMRSAQRDFRRWIPDLSLKADGPQRDLWSGRAEGLLSPDEVAEVNRHITAARAVLQRAKRSDSGGRPYQLTWSFSPSD